MDTISSPRTMQTQILYVIKYKHTIPIYCTPGPKVSTTSRENLADISEPQIAHLEQNDPNFVFLIKNLILNLLTQNEQLGGSEIIAEFSMHVTQRKPKECSYEMYML